MWLMYFIAVENILIYYIQPLEPNERLFDVGRLFNIIKLFDICRGVFLSSHSTFFACLDLNTKA